MEPAMSLLTMSLFDSASQSFATSAPDSRADGGIRTIRFSPRGVRIERQVAGIKMYLAVPICAYEAVVLTCEDRADQRYCTVSLVHHDPEMTVVLHEAPEAPEVLTIWRSWAHFFARPALCGEALGTSHKEIRGLGLPRPRRRGQPLTERRPRFLKRRRCGRLDRIGGPFRAARASLAHE
jgi:hypothetical protein